jgi:hypothetical protein
MRITLVALLALLTGCGARPGTPSRSSDHWAESFLVDRPGCVPETQRYGRHIALSCGRHVYGSNGDDLPSQVVAALAPLSAVGESPHVALIGIGSGAELGTLLRGGATVDLYEPDAALLANAESLGVSSGLVYRAGRPTHPSLRIITSIGSAPDPAPLYDAIVHANAETVLTTPPRLFVRERFSALAERLRPGGVLSLHLQLYEMHEHDYLRFLQTFASWLGEGELAVIVGEARSTDTLLVGSTTALAFDADRLTALWSRPELTGTLGEGARMSDPFELYARVVLHGRAELEAWARGARPFTAAEPYPEAAWPTRPLQPIEGDRASDAQWEAWNDELAAWTAGQGFDALSVRLADSEWAWGRGCDRDARCPVAGRALSVPERERFLASLLRDGFFERAVDVIETMPRTAELGRLVEVMVILLGELLAIDVFSYLGSPASTPAELALERDWTAAGSDAQSWAELAQRVAALSPSTSDETMRRRLVQLYAEARAGGETLANEVDWLEAYPEPDAVTLSLLAFALSRAGDDRAAFSTGEQAVAALSR